MDTSERKVRGTVEVGVKGGRGVVWRVPLLLRGRTHKTTVKGSLGKRGFPWHSRNPEGTVVAINRNLCLSGLDFRDGVVNVRY